LGFIVGMYHDVRSSEYQKNFMLLQATKESYFLTSYSQ